MTKTDVMIISKDSEVIGFVLNATIKTKSNFLMYLIGPMANLKLALVKYLKSLYYAIYSLKTGLTTLSMKGLRDISIIDVSGFYFGQH